MPLPKLPYSDYVVYVDESGDHAMKNPDMSYPVFVLVFCIFKKSEYSAIASPAVQNFKFKYFGHDMAILHEREIRKAKAPFAFLQKKETRMEFMGDLNNLIVEAPFTAIAVVIRKDELAVANPYHLAMKYGLERTARYIREHEGGGRTVHVVCESRGGVEDRELELEFLRVRDSAAQVGLNSSADLEPSKFEIIFADKRVNSSGLQLADMIARPIGRRVMNPEQANRAWDIIETKLRKSPAGLIDGWGLKCFPY